MKSPSSHKVRTPRSFLGPAAAVAAALSAGALLFACAGSEVPVDDTPATPDAATTAAPKPSTSATAPARDAAVAPQVCTNSCTQDSDCASTCPAAAGAACCDVASKTCFRSNGATCPAPQGPFDAATPPGPY